MRCGWSQVWIVDRNSPNQENFIVHECFEEWANIWGFVFFLGRHECLQSQLHTPNAWCWSLQMSICPCSDIVDVGGECRRLVEVVWHVLPMIEWKSRYRRDRQWHTCKWKVIEGHPYITWRSQVHWLSWNAWLTIQTILPWFWKSFSIHQWNRLEYGGIPTWGRVS